MTGTEQVHKVWDIMIVKTCIRYRSAYDIIMPSIYMIYTRYIPNSNGMYLEYIWYISCIYLAYLSYPGIYQVYALIITDGWCLGGGHGPIQPGTAPSPQCI